MMLLDGESTSALQAVLLKEGIDSFSIERNDHPYMIAPSVLKDLSARLLCQDLKSVLLVGPSGSGKTSLVRYLANYFHQSSHPLLRQLRILCINVPSLLAGSEYRGSFEKKVTLVLNECQSYENLIVFFDEAHSLRFTNFREGVGLMDILKPRMSNTNLRTILATTELEMEHLKRDSAFMRRLHVIELSPLLGDEMETVAKRHLERLIRSHNSSSTCRISVSDIDLADLLSRGLSLHALIDAMDFEISKAILNAHTG